MFNKEYITDLESALEVKIPLEESPNAVFNTVYDTLTKSFNLDGNVTKAPENIVNELDGNEIFYTPFVGIAHKSVLYKDLKQATYAVPSPIDPIFQYLSKYTATLAGCKGNEKNMAKAILDNLVVIVSEAGSLAGIINACTAGSMGPYIEPICAGISYMASFLSKLTVEEHSFTGIVLNDSNKDANIDMAQGHVFPRYGKIVALPGRVLNPKFYIPMSESTKSGSMSYAGFYKFADTGHGKGAGGLIRFTFKDSNPKHIDLMGYCPFMFSNITGIKYNDGHNPGRTFDIINYEDDVVSFFDEDGVKGHSAIAHMEENNGKGCSWFSFKK